MYRITLFLSLAVVACGPAAAMVDPPEEGGTLDDITSPDTDVADDEAHVRAAAPTRTCALHADAPAGTPTCVAGVVCDTDADCAAYPGNYCDLDSCALDGCLRGRCRLTKVQGQACIRDAECVSGSCACATADGSCVCAPQEGEPDFQGP